MSLVQFGHGAQPQSQVSQQGVHFCGAHCVQHNAKPADLTQFGGDTIHFCGGNCAQHGGG